MSSDTLVHAQNLCRHYGPHRAVQNLNLSLRRGEVLGLLGPNGAGKTSTLRMLTGCLAPSAGSVHIGAYNMATHAREAKSQLGYLPETPPLHRDLSVTEYLNYCAGLHGIVRSARRAAVNRALEACGLESVARQLIGSLSKGYQQRVGLAQAIVHRPALIVLDEPTVGLDPNQMRQIRTLIQDLAHEHAIVLSSHILSEVQAVCGRVAIMRRGEIVFDQALANIGDGLSNPARITIGLRRPPTTDALAAIEGVQHVTALADGHFELQTIPTIDIREDLVALAVNSDWGLVELHSESTRSSHNLEQVFAELTV